LPARSKKPDTPFSEESPKPDGLVLGCLSLVDEEPPTCIVGPTKTGRAVEGIGVADLAGINHQAHAAVAGPSAGVEGAKGAIAIVSLVVDEEADPEVGGRPLPLTSGLMLVVTVCEGVRESSCASIPRRSEIHTSGIPADH